MNTTHLAETCQWGMVLMAITGPAIILNLSVVLSLLINIRSLPPYMSLVLNLALSDLAFAIAGFSIRGPGLIYRDYYKQSGTTIALCKSAMFFYLPVIVSINTSVMLLTYDRKCAIKTPLHRGIMRSKRRVAEAIALSWFMSLSVLVGLLSTVVAGVSGNLYDEKFGRCSLTSTTGGEIFHFFMYLVFLMLPAVGTLVFYAQIVSTLWGYRKAIKQRAHFTRRHSRVFVQNELKQVGSKIKKNTFFTITIILVFYHLTLFPSFLLRDCPMMLSLIFGRDLELPSDVTIGTSVAFYLSTLTDPVVYGVRSPHIFKTLKTMIWHVSRDEDVSEFESRVSSQRSLLSGSSLSRSGTIRSRSHPPTTAMPIRARRAGVRQRPSSAPSVSTITELPNLALHRGSIPVAGISVGGGFSRQGSEIVSPVFVALMPVLSRVRITRMKLKRTQTASF